jgi:hypothetical protein
MVFAVGFSPDGKTLDAGGSKGMEGGVLKLWDVAARQERKVIDFSSPVYCLAPSPDSQTLAAGCADGTVKLLDMESGRDIALLKGHKAPVRCLAFTPDGKTLAAGSQDSTTILWDLAAGKERLTLKGHTSTVWSATFTPDGRTLATGSADATAKLWDAATGDELATCRGHHREIRAIAIDPRGKRLATASGDHTVKLWDVASGELLLTLRSSDHLWSLAFSPDGKTLAAGNHDGSVNLWRAATESEVAARNADAESFAAARSAPDDPDLAGFLRDVAASNKRNEELKRAAQLKQNLDWGRSALAQRRLRSAAMQLNAAAKLAPMDEAVLRALKELDQARKSAKPEYQKTMQEAATLEKEEKFALAARCCQRAQELAPSDDEAMQLMRKVTVFFSLAQGQKHLQARRFAEAQGQFETVLKMSPGHPAATKLLEQAKQQQK